MEDTVATPPQETTSTDLPEPAAELSGPVAELSEPVAELSEPAAELSGPAAPSVDKRRLAEQLEALKRKELELRRALAVADHPDLADAIRLLDGRAYALTRIEAKLAQGLSKSEERRKETLEKKLGALRAKAAELAAQIAPLEAELESLVHSRAAGLQAERRAALNELIACLGEHAAALSAAGLDAADLVPEIGQRMAEIRAAAQELVDMPRTEQPPLAQVHEAD